jgi:deoxyribose-phosphate aldolase
VELGADEVDIVLNRSLFLGGRYAQAFDELVAAREAGRPPHLKVILETGELGSYRPGPQARAGHGGRRRLHQDLDGQDRDRATSRGALHDGGRRDFHRDRPQIGIKVAGGVRASKQAIQYLVLCRTLGAAWMTPERSGSARHAAERRVDADRQGTHRPVRARLLHVD